MSFLRSLVSASLIIILAQGAFAAARSVEQPPSQPGLKEWTFLIYINADNNLDANGPEDMNEMERVGSTDQVNIVVQIDREGATGTWRHLIQKDDDASTVTSPILETMPEQDMGSPDTLKAFIKWGMEKYPAKKFAISIWNHGSGWEKRGRFGTKGVSYDDESGNNLTVKQVGQVMKEIADARGQKTELLGYDACLMQMAEVADEVTSTVNFRVASEETEPLDGWPYDDFFSKVVAHPEWNGGQVGSALVEAYQASYSAGGSRGENDTTLSVIDLGRFAELKVAADAFTKACNANPDNREKVLTAIRSSQSYAESDHKDFVDFVDQITAVITDAQVTETAATLKAALSNKVVVASGHTGDSMANSHGLAVWIPTWFSQGLMERYKELNWASASQWDEFVNSVGTVAGGGNGGGDGDGGDDGEGDDDGFRANRRVETFKSLQAR